MKRWRKRWVAALVVGVLLVAGGAAALSKLDLERRHADPERLSRLAASVLPATDPGQLPAEDWPQWRGPYRDGLSRETGLLTSWPAEGPTVAWKTPIGRGFSSVAIVHGRLFTMEEEPAGPGEGQTPHHEAVICRDARSGVEIWRFHYANTYFERFGSGPRSTPAVDGNQVFAVGPTGIFHCLRADTGEKVWCHDLADDLHGREMRYGMSFSPLVDGSLVYATPGGADGHCVLALDRHTGRVVWRALDDPMGYSSPILANLAGVRQLLVFTNTALVSLSPTSGEVYWRYPWETKNGFNIATPLAFGPYVFISSAYQKGCALLEITAEADGSLRPHLVYEHNRLRSYFSTCVRWGEHIYGFDEMDLVCMNVRSGAVVWREKGARRFRKGSLLIAAGHLLVLGEEGTLSLAEATPAGYREKAHCRVSQHKCWTAPVLAGGRLYLRDESQLLCLDLAREAPLPGSLAVAGKLP